MTATTHISAASIALLLACAPGAETAQKAGLDDTQRRAISSAVDSATHAYLNAVAAKDAERVIAHYANEPDFMAYFDAAPMNHDQISTTVRGMFGGLSAVDLKPVTVQVTVLGPDAAIAGFTFRESFTDTSKKVTRLRGTASWTWTRRGTDWKIIHGDAVHLPDTTSAKD